MENIVKHECPLSQIQVAHLIALVCLCVGGCRQSDSGALTEYSFDAGILFLDPNNSYDWIARHTFTYTNRMDKAITLSVKHKTCGCATCVLSKDTLLPGETSQIEIGYALRFQPEIRKETVVIGSSDGTDFALSLMGQFIPRLMLVHTPRHITLKSNEHFTEPLNLIIYSPLDKQVLNIKDIKASSDTDGLKASDVKFLSTRESNGVKETIIQVMITYSIPDGVNTSQSTYLGVVNVHYGEFKASRQLAWQRESQIKCSPEKVFFNCVANSTANTKVTLRSNSQFRLLRVTPETSDVSASAAIDVPAKEHTIDLDARTPQSEVAGRSSHVTVITDHGIDREIRIPVHILY